MRYNSNTWVSTFCTRLPKYVDRKIIRRSRGRRIYFYRLRPGITILTKRWFFWSDPSDYLAKEKSSRSGFR
ncbi:MAG: hypothetical protein KAT30_07515, partial [Candidatus Krumholzibacteria bacterium]|nr:hypothetical protein [Candidatus Krumholzibacteria bacterium]